MIFQDPLTCMHPVLTVGCQIPEALTAHDPALDRRAAWARVVELLELSASPTRGRGSTSTRTSSRAGRASGR
ncbi:MAG: hypothetical protein ACRDYX_01695 [Egibacteraceae bacterium]